MSEVENLNKYKEVPLDELLAASEAINDHIDRSLPDLEAHRQLDDDVLKEHIRVYNAMYWRLTEMNQLAEGTHRDNW